MIDAKKFKEMTGNDPADDDLERCNCEKAGKPGHLSCGICEDHNQPRFRCGCLLLGAKKIEDYEDKKKGENDVT